MYGELIVRLGAGAHFGERALLSSEPRSATITAYRNKLELLVLKRQDYERLLASRDRAELMEITNALEDCLSVADITGSGLPSAPLEDTRRSSGGGLAFIRRL